MRYRFYPSTKTCSSCGHLQEMPLKERVFNCEACHISIGRDLNASLNARTLRRRLFGLSLWIGYCRQSEMKQRKVRSRRKPLEKELCKTGTKL
ncbi:MAG: transposase [Limnoraphis sp. WC205]|nr:transposase [Limnoraphis sp. WC205]